MSIQKDRSSKKDNLCKIECCYFDIFCLQIENDKRDQLEQKHKHILPPQHSLLFFHIMIPEYRKAKIRVHDDQKDNQIF